MLNMKLLQIFMLHNKEDKEVVKTFQGNLQNLIFLQDKQLQVEQSGILLLEQQQ